MTATSIWDPRFLVFADRLHHWFRRLVEEIIEPEMAEFFGCGEKEKKESAYNRLHLPRTTDGGS